MNDDVNILDLYKSQLNYWLVINLPIYSSLDLLCLDLLRQQVEVWLEDRR